MRNRRFMAVLVLAALPVLAWGADARTQLEEFVTSVKAARGSFTQTTLAQQSNVVRSTQSGHFAFRRPGQFKWHIEKPYEQLLVSDGKIVQQYDPDLDQVTERALDQSMGASPAALLFGLGSLSDAFDIQLLPDDDGLQWLRATPKQDNAGFMHVDIGLKQQLPARLRLLDVFGQMTDILLDNITANPQLAEDEFRFEVPPGVDYIKVQPEQM